MSIDEVLKKVRPDVDFCSSVNFVEDGLLDSLDIISLIALIEANFGINVDGADLLPEYFANIESIQRLIDKSRSASDLKK
jgi:acyl carrier protein